MKRHVVILLVASAVAGVGIAAAAEPEGNPNVPLPAGGNFNGIRWPDDEKLAQPVVDSTLAYNATCQWLRAWRDGRDERAPEVLADLARSPAIEAAGSGSVLAQLAEEVAAGGGESVPGILRSCDASHAREVAYARERGLTPST